MSRSSETNELLTNLTKVFDIQRGSSYETVGVIFIVVVTGSINLITILGNILVIISIKTNRHLRTINNYFIFSLACADLILGAFTMNVFTIYTALGYWPFGPVFCDLWLVVDYAVNNASGMNILVISFDRYFCVTKPLSYPLRRTTKIAGIMIAAAWVVPFFLWVPGILFWQFIVQARTIPVGECYPQLLSNPAITLAIVIACFYLPATIMVTLYGCISCASKSRIKRAKKESVPNKGFSSPNLWKAYIKKTSTNNASNVSKQLLDAKSQNIKITAGITIDKYGQGEREKVITETNSLGFSPPNQKKEEAIHDCAKVMINPTKLAYMKIASNTQIRTCTGTMVGLATDSNNMDAVNREVRPNYEIIKMTKMACMNKIAVNRDKTVTRTILAIILAYIITWTPYIAMMIISTFCPTCITKAIWNFGYWIIYINSTINPACYALCNATFKNTFKRLLFCQYRNIADAK
ncbi:muscarinic acetylcholine receptor M2-like [Hemiscyllium ocellatum]|uniref:muscarinic acetylcholine receptor M2-like n=1 Tax=Hemiscyllium ocellatum TaxID=170820 RepID=UPI002965F89C|nr:muscarinic acetylcholine receptor M2-like [Hemiscyllium ocellatum]